MFRRPVAKSWVSRLESVSPTFLFRSRMHSIQSLLVSRHSVRRESVANATQSEETDETDEEKEKEREKHNGLRRNLATKPQFSRKRDHH
jgi:hypothetical protein